jgi:DNA modification methylase
MKRMPGSSVDAIVTDPPYGLEFMGKGWDGFGTPLGFQTWTEAWAVEAFRILKPGGHLLAFAGTRTYHRMASGVEDAGFEIRDCIAWMYGSGFPKSLDVSKAIDKTDASDEQQARRYRFTEWVRSTGLTAKQIDNATGTLMGNHYTTHPTQPAIMTREHLEAIRHLVAEIPEWVEAECDKRSVESKNMANREVTGERIVPLGPGFASEKYQGDNTGSKDYADTLPHTVDATKWNGWGTALKPAFEPIVVARRPLIGTVAANVLEHGTGALNIDGCRIGMSDQDRNTIEKATWVARDLDRKAYGKYDTDGTDQVMTTHPSGRWPANVALDATAAAMLDEQSGERSAGNFPANNRTGFGGTYRGATEREGITQDRQPTDTGGASRFFYTAKASRQDRNVGGLADNTHPTVKPTDLMRWLIRLVTPPGGIILDPFGGSGSTGLAARAENVRCILIEREPEYLQIIRDRLAQQNLFATETTTNAT